MTAQDSMNSMNSMKSTASNGLGLSSNQRVAAVCFIIFIADQLSKLWITKGLGLELNDERQIIPGFFRLVHWGNTGAAWSMFHGNNHLLALIAVVAFAILVWKRHHFDIHRAIGQCALGFLLGGIAGNVTDRLRVNHVIDFLLFYVQRRGVNPADPNAEAIFPAFNVADAAICTGVGLLFLMSLRNDPPAPAPGSSQGHSNNPKTS